MLEKSIDDSQKKRLIEDASQKKPVQSDPVYYFDYSERYRILLFVLVLVCALFLGPPTMNWPPIREMFEKAGAFNQLCENPFNLVDVRCDAKRTAIENLGGRANSIYFSTLIVCGTLLDLLGPKLCSIFGLVVAVLGWILIGSSSPGFQAFDIGIYLITSTIDAAFFALLSIGNLFPGYATTILGFLGSARSISFAIPLLMGQLNNAGVSLRVIAFSYAFIFSVVMSITIYFLPYRPFPRLPTNLALDRVPADNKVSIKEYTSQFPDMSKEQIRLNTVQQLKNIFLYWLQPSFWAFIVILCMNLTRNGYYIETTFAHLPHTEWLYTIMAPLSFIPCPFLGYLVDRYAATLSLGIMCTCGMTSVLVLLARSLAGEYVSIFINWVFISFTGSECYCYVAYVYPQRVQGMLTGFAFLIAGLVSFSSNSMNKFIKVSKRNETIMDTIVVIGECIGIVLCSLIYLKMERILRAQRQRAEASIAQTTDSEQIPEKFLV